MHELPYEQRSPCRANRGGPRRSKVQCRSCRANRGGLVESELGAAVAAPNPKWRLCEQGWPLVRRRAFQASS
eukprot:4376376-Lingulodinium_polyedra.AAC.1